MGKLKIGFIGCGSISYGHLYQIKKIEDVEITGVFDPKKENVNKFLSEAGEGKIFTSEEELIKNVDAVIICSPHTSHFPQIKTALENGVDVLVEKPAVVNYEEAIKLRKLIEKTGRKVVVGYQKHYMELPLSVKKIIQEGKIGKILFLSGFLSQNWIEGITKSGRIWRFDPKFSGKGQLTDSGSHFISMLFWITSLTPEKVGAFIEFFDKKVDINSSFTVKFKEGALGSFSILGIDPSYREALMIWGEKGLIKLSLFGENSYIHYNGEKEPKKISVSKPTIISPVDDLIKCIRENKEPETDISVIEKVALLSDKIYESFNKEKIVNC
ncbi:MAG TPA: Gfo/Idh/MocA family oxidoreductase [bacterium]|nr:Gfo/Idh/MocA family oxidoreductase [bacterium]